MKKLLRRYSSIAEPRKALLVVCMALLGALSYFAMGYAQPQPSTENQIAMTKTPRPTYKRTINLDPNFYVARLAYSPDGRYLAIGDAASPTILVWDVEQNHEQSRIHTRSNEGQPTLPNKWLHWEPGQEIHWSPDGRYITNGVGNAFSNWKGDLLKTIEFWDPMTGKVIHELPAIAVTGMARFNRDGSKFLVHSGQFGALYRYTFIVYDTHTWQSKGFDTGGVIINKLTWTFDDKILVIGFANPPDQGNLSSANGRILAHGSTVARVIDLNGKQSPITLLFEPHKQGKPGYSCEVLIPDFLNHRVVIVGSNDNVTLFDTASMQILYSIDPKNLKYATDGSWGHGLSRDGRYLFLVKHEHKESAESFILDLQTGESVSNFTSENTWGLALNPDGKTFAVGRGREILIYDVQ